MDQQWPHHYFEFDEHGLANLLVQYTGEVWTATINAETECTCPNGIRHPVRVSETRTIDHHFSYVDDALLSAYEGALRGELIPARRVFTLLVMDAVSSVWVDPCGPEISDDGDIVTF